MADHGLSGHFHLPPSLLYILLSLAGGEMTRDEIRERVAKYSQELDYWNIENLKSRIKFLSKRHWIETNTGPRSPEDARRRNYYRLLPEGLRALEQELERLQSIITLGKHQLSRGSPHSPKPPTVIAQSSLPNRYWQGRLKREEAQTARILKKKTVSANEAAAVLHVSQTAVYKMVEEERLRATVLPTKSGKRKWRISAASVRRAIRQRSASPAPRPKVRTEQRFSAGETALSVAEAANYLSVCRKTIRNWLRKGILEEASPEGDAPKRVTIASLNQALESARVREIRKHTPFEWV